MQKRPQSINVIGVIMSGEILNRRVLSMKKIIKYMKRFIKYISRIALGLISVYIGLITLIAFKLDVLDCSKGGCYCLIPHFDHCILILTISLALLYVVWFITYDW